MAKLREVSLDLGTEYGLTKKINVKSIFINIGFYDKEKGEELVSLNKEEQKIRVDYEILWIKEEDNTIFKKEDKYYVHTDNGTLTNWDETTTNDELGKAFSDRILWYLSNFVVPNL